MDLLDEYLLLQNIYDSLPDEEKERLEDNYDWLYVDETGGI